MVLTIKATCSKCVYIVIRINIGQNYFHSSRLHSGQNSLLLWFFLHTHHRQLNEGTYSKIHKNYIKNFNYNNSDQKRTSAYKIFSMYGYTICPPQVAHIEFLNKKKQLDSNDNNFIWILFLDELHFRHAKNYCLALYCLHTRRFVFSHHDLYRLWA